MRRPVSGQTTAVKAVGEQSLRQQRADAYGVTRSLVAHLLREQDLGGSNPSTPTNFS